MSAYVVDPICTQNHKGFCVHGPRRRGFDEPRPTAPPAPWSTHYCDKYGKWFTRRGREERWKGGINKKGA